ncbi:MFS transporter [Piscirickettsia salmonis]|uniref:MFS transporter n=1 Tax=Piscirickettsia salmonis TaxID=1238 RepID=UPI0007D7B336|nr:Proline/betaine transporter [Piscirickettsiaceae bacterium NZ-RLO1]
MNKNKVSLTVCAGNILEWYDYNLYAQLAPIIAILFFPSKSHTTSLIFAYSTYILSFAIRPVASIFLGKVADNCGRKRVLLISSTIMAVCTLLIGLLPTYNQIGITAPLILIALRLFQGVAVSVEFTGSTSYQFERNSSKKKLLGSLVQATTFLGTFFAAISIAIIGFLLPYNELASWGWRVPFILAGFFGFVLIKARLALPESHEFLKEKKLISQTKNDINIYMVILSFFIPAAATAGLYFFIYQVSYITSFIHIQLSHATLINSCAILIVVLLIPIIAKAGDRYDIQKVLYVGLGLLIITALPLFWLMSQQSLIMIILGQLLFAVILSPYLGLNAVFMASLYPTHIRITVFSFVYNLAVAIFGSSIPLVAIYLHEKVHFKFASGIYFMAMCLISLIALILLGKYKSTTNKHLSSQSTHPAIQSQLA